MTAFGQRGEQMTAFGQKDLDAIRQEPQNTDFIFISMPQQLLIYIYYWMSKILILYVTSDLISRYSDYYCCLPAYLFYCQKGIVLHLCQTLLFPVLYQYY